MKPDFDIQGDLLEILEKNQDLSPQEILTRIFITCTINVVYNFYESEPDNYEPVKDELLDIYKVSFKKSLEIIKIFMEDSSILKKNKDGLFIKVGD